MYYEYGPQYANSAVGNDDAMGQFYSDLANGQTCQPDTKIIFINL